MRTIQLVLALTAGGPQRLLQATTDYAPHAIISHLSEVDSMTEL